MILSYSAYIDGLMKPTTLVARAGEDLLDRFPKAERAVAHCNFRGNAQPTAFQVDEELAPALGAFPHANLEADELFLALGRRPEQHQHAIAMLFHAGLQVNAVGPGIDLVARRA